MNPISCNELADFIEANPGFLQRIKPFLVDHTGEYLAPDEGICLDHVHALYSQEESGIVRDLRSCGKFTPCFSGGDSLVGITEIGLVFNSPARTPRSGSGLICQMLAETKGVRLVERTRPLERGSGNVSHYITPFYLPPSQL